MFIIILAVFGALGTLARYSMQGLVQNHSTPFFPVGTLAVNLSGCFLFGGITRLAMAHLWFPAEWRMALTVGFLGAFTTFSTFGWETFRMLEDGEWSRAAFYIAASLVGGLIGIMIGVKVADLL